MKRTVYIFGLIICAIIIIINVINYMEKYSIKPTKSDIENAIHERSNINAIVRDYVVTDNKIHFVFIIGENGNVGSGELIRGLNNKYKLEFYGHGTNWIRERIIETNKGHYLKLAGRNNERIGSIKAFVDDEVHEVAIPMGDYYIILTPISETALVFSSAMIVYDREGKELQRMNLPAENL